MYGRMGIVVDWQIHFDMSAIRDKNKKGKGDSKSRKKGARGFGIVFFSCVKQVEKLCLSFSM